MDRSLIPAWKLLLSILLTALAATSLTAQNKLSYPVVGTGQKKCYDSRGNVIRPDKADDYYGQDAQFPSMKPDYTDNGNGTVTDNNTGLMWQKKFKQIEWRNAAKDAAKDRTGGYSDWRVPTVKELYSLIDFSGQTGSAGPSSQTAPRDAIPYLDTRVFAFEYPTRGRFIDAQYITCTVGVSPIMGGMTGFFGVNFADGRIKCYPLSGRPQKPMFYARYVRGNPDYGINRFSDNGDGTITDQATGLTWMKIDSGAPLLRDSLRNYARKDGSMDWREALDFSKKLNYAGKNDWRLPDAKELQSLVDYSRSVDKTRSAAISPLFQCTAIRNEDGKYDFPYYWTSTTHLDGRKMGTDAVYIAFGRALGYMATRGAPRGEKRWLDVHGSGAQRSDPKVGNPADLPLGHGPQGDARRIYNFVRCVRGGPAGK